MNNRRVYRTTAYRYPGEQAILLVSIGLSLFVIFISALFTLGGALLLVLGMIFLSYMWARNHHQGLLRQAYLVTPQSAPNLNSLVQTCQQRLQPGPIQSFVVPSRALNAYTFGLDSPKVVVVYSPLLDLMDADELRFIIGHEMGHVALGHTWLNSLIGGMAGVPSSLLVAALLALVLRGWNRSCEFSADRAGLLACGKPEKAVSALVKLVAPQAGSSPQAMQRVIEMLDAQDEEPVNLLAELGATHPLMIRRIENLRRYAHSAEFQRLAALLDQNVA